MKRDIDLIRAIALAVEAQPPAEPLFDLPGTDQDLFAGHVQLMLDADLVEASVRPPLAAVIRLTAAGHDFLDAARSDTLWAKAKESVIKPTGSWTLGILTEWLKTEIKSGLPSLRTLAN